LQDVDNFRDSSTKGRYCLLIATVGVGDVITVKFLSAKMAIMERNSRFTKKKFHVMTAEVNLCGWIFVR